MFWSVRLSRVKLLQLVYGDKSGVFQIFKSTTDHLSLFSNLYVYVVYLFHLYCISIHLNWWIIYIECSTIKKIWVGPQLNVQIFKFIFQNIFIINLFLVTLEFEYKYYITVFGSWDLLTQNSSNYFMGIRMGSSKYHENYLSLYFEEKGGVFVWLNIK